MNRLVEILWLLSLIPLLFIPYSIALFYQRRFMRNTYPYLFLVSFILLAASSLLYIDSYFSDGMLFFAIGGILLGLTSMRLEQVMTRRNK
ncbi:Uncharacterised protein [uncultured archaeon]|nr:Uncharacterised protein [uncultured archaeon]